MHDDGAIVRMEAKLPKRYLDLVRALGATANTEQTLRLFEKLTMRYREPHRHFHVLSHIAYCVIVFDRVAQYAYNPNLILMAIFYKNIIHDPRRRDNAKKSAQYFSMIAPNLLGLTDEHVVGEIARFITLQHATVDPETDPDAALFIDICAAILSEDPWLYDRSMYAVRREYDFFDDDDWAAGRIGFFLDPLIERGRIYLTGTFARTLDERAIANLMEERARLQAR